MLSDAFGDLVKDSLEGMGAKGQKAPATGPALRKGPGAGRPPAGGGGSRVGSQGAAPGPGQAAQSDLWDMPARKSGVRTPTVPTSSPASLGGGECVETFFSGLGLAQGSPAQGGGMDDIFGGPPSQPAPQAGPEDLLGGPASGAGSIPSASGLDDLFGEGSSAVASTPILSSSGDLMGMADVFGGEGAAAATPAAMGGPQGGLLDTGLPGEYSVAATPAPAADLDGMDDFFSGSGPGSYSAAPPEPPAAQGPGGDAGGLQEAAPDVPPPLSQSLRATVRWPPPRPSRCWRCQGTWYPGPRDRRGRLLGKPDPSRTGRGG